MKHLSRWNFQNYAKAVKAVFEIQSKAELSHCLTWAPLEMKAVKKVGIEIYKIKAIKRLSHSKICVAYLELIKP